MPVAQMPEALAERLGPDGARGLVGWLDSARADWRGEVTTEAVDRFDRLLAIEMSATRVELARELSALRQDFTRELSAVRVELLKWSFVFWVGQIATVAGLLAFALRS